MRAIAILLAASLVLTACGAETVSDEPAFAVTTTTTTTTTTVAPSSTVGDAALAFATEADDPADVDEAPAPELQAEPVSTALVCELLEPLYIARATIRTTLFTATEEEIDLQLDRMGQVEHALEDAGVFDAGVLDRHAVGSFFYAERALPNRLNHGGALFSEDIAANETAAEPLHEFTRSSCPDIGAELLDYGSAGDRTEEVFEEEDRRRLVTYCAMFEELLTQRQNLRNAAAAGQLDDDTLASFIGLFGNWDETLVELPELAAWVDLQSDGLEYALQHFVNVEMEVRQATLGPGYIPASDESIEIGEGAATGVVEAAQRSCPELPQDLLTTPPALSTYVSESYAVPTPLLHWDDGDTAEDFCIRVIPLLLAHDTMVQHLGQLDPTNEDHWTDFAWAGYRTYRIAQVFGDTATLAGGGRDEQRHVELIGELAITAFIDRDPPVDAATEVEAVTALRDFTSLTCTGVPASIVDEASSVVALLGPLSNDRPETES